MSIVITAADFEGLEERFLAAVAKFGTSQLARVSGLSRANIARLRRSPEALWRSRGTTAIRLIVALRRFGGGKEAA